MLETNSVTVVHQRLRDEHGLGVGITSFRRYVELEFPERDQLAQVTVLRPEVPPGDEAQVDYGLLGTWFDPVTARRRRVWAFVMVLSLAANERRDADTDSQLVADGWTVIRVWEHEDAQSAAERIADVLHREKSGRR